MAKQKTKKESRVIAGLVRLYELPADATSVLTEIVQTFRGRGVETPVALREAGMACKIATRHKDYVEPLKFLKTLKRTYAIGLKRSRSRINNFLGRSRGTYKTFGEIVEQSLYREGEAMMQGPAFLGYLERFIAGKATGSRGHYTRDAQPRGKIYLDGLGWRPKKTLPN